MLVPPFVLLDDARDGGAPARLYRNPVELIEAHEVDRVRPALDRLRAATGAGLHAAGFLSCEAAPAFEPTLPTAAPGGPLLWFGLFDRFEEVDPAALLPDPAGARVAPPVPHITRAEYDSRVARVLALIAAGDLYQANLTFQATVAFLGDPLALYAAVRPRAAAGWGGVVATARELILSFSPELFFSLSDGEITCRPMKGTAPADAPPASLADDPKQRAENLMIVDLLRNDLSRIAAAGSVAVPELFTVERYPSVLQMTSAVTARLAPGRDAIDLLAAAYPCGSITGAPKLRAIEALADIEKAPRGVYTGSIGRLDPDGSAQFNVAIRTLVVRDGAATMGLGGGIVADSTADEEWVEALAKGAFLTRGQRPVDLIETMRFDPLDGVLLLDRHLARMAASAAALGFAFDRHAARNDLQAATFRLREGKRVRLLLAASGAIAVEISALPAAPAGPLPVALVPLPVEPTDWRLRHKSSDRAFYDDARREAGSAEVAFVDPHGCLTEGSYTSLFVARGGTLVTPPLARGLLPGVLRAELLATGRAVEDDLTPADLAGEFLIGNALRGLLPATVAQARPPAIARRD